MGFPLGQFCDCITIEKSLSIKNQRLGVVFRLLQIGAVVLVMMQIAVSRAWNTTTIPVSYGLEMWTVEGTEAAANDMDVTHCSDPLSLKYVYQENKTYGPTSCKRLALADAYNKNGPSLFFPIHVEDTYVDAQQGKCAGVTCAGKAVKKEHLKTCECQETDTYFVQNPEANVLVINHGFSVDQVDMYGRKKQEHGRSVMEDEKNEILTIVTMNGKRDARCEVGGRKEWPLSASKQGIQGSLKDWMACGGMDLDDSVPTSRSYMKGEGAAPRARILGLNMQISLIYTNNHDEDHEGAVCYIEVVALSVWNSHNAIAYTQVPTLESANSSFRSRYQIGISVSLQASGSFNWFDLNALVLIITSSLVLLKLPGTIVQVLATKCVGRLSKIYTAVAVESFSIVDRFHGLCARLLGHKMSYEAITAGKGNSPMKQETLLANLTEVLADEAKAGILCESEIQKMSHFLMAQMDTAGTDSISLQEFLQASNNNEAIKMTDLSSFFDDDFKMSILEKIFGDVASGIKADPTAGKVAPSAVVPQ